MNVCSPSKSYPTSAFMRLGQGLSNNVKTENLSFLDLGLCEVDGMDWAKPNFSESDLFAVFISANKCDSHGL